MTTIQLNGEKRTLDTQLSIEQLLLELGVPVGTVLVERNRQVVAREKFTTCLLEDGDVLELVRFVGGG